MWPWFSVCRACCISRWALAAAWWPTGSVRGLRARDGFEVDVEWRHRALVRAQVRSTRGGALRIRSGDVVREYATKPGQVVAIDATLVQSR